MKIILHKSYKNSESQLVLESTGSRAFDLFKKNSSDTGLNIEKTRSLDKPVALTIGTFDGMHLGHQYLIKTMVEISKQNKFYSMIFTFRKHPMLSLDPKNSPPLLMPLHQKILDFKKLGLDYILIQDFDHKFAQISPRDFISLFCSHYGIRHIVIGHDFRFGHDSAGDISLLKELAVSEGFDVTTISPYKINDMIVSSSAIRTFLRQGKVKEAESFLGYPYSLRGEVISGFGRGTKLGFPTANLQVRKEIALPGFGVYLTKAFIEQKEFWGATSIGKNPTFSQDETQIETYFLNLNQNLYGKRLKLYFIEKIRDQIRFDTIDGLVNQIGKDVNYIKYLICKNRKLC